jgi:lipoprotein-anchoring transpeptidase ErfK/SrfK
MPGLTQKLSRRDFLKTSLMGAGAVALRPWTKWSYLQSDWPDAERLGRNCTGGWINLRARPNSNADILEKLYEDTVVVWLREVIGDYDPFLLGQRWVETPKGYLYAPVVQPVENHPNQPLDSLPTTSLGKGMWAEVTVPYVDIFLANPPARSPWVKEVPKPRLYYSQVMWIDDITTNSQGQILYRVNEQYGSYGDIFWAAAEAFRPITEEEVSPIHPDAVDKKILVDLNYQTLSCLEGQQEVYFCRVSTGAKFDASGNVVDKWSTPVGEHLPWRKVISIHMSGGSTGAGYDTAGIPWNLIFDPDGAAVHATFWHNDFGTPRSHGCVNCSPKDAKWIYRWSLPVLPLIPGDQTISGEGATHVTVVGA